MYMYVIMIKFRYVIPQMKRSWSREGHKFHKLKPSKKLQDIVHILQRKLFFRKVSIIELQMG
jgi:hypothetical protein